MNRRTGAVLTALLLAFSGAPLAGLAFSGVAFSGVVFSGVAFSGAAFSCDGLSAAGFSVLAFSAAACAGAWTAPFAPSRRWRHCRCSPWAMRMSRMRSPSRSGLVGAGSASCVFIWVKPFSTSRGAAETFAPGAPGTLSRGA